MVVGPPREDKVEHHSPDLQSSPALIHPHLLDFAVLQPRSMVAIKNHRKHNNNDDTPIIFPPANHENLHIPPDLPSHICITDLDYSSDSDLVSESDSNSSSVFSPSDSDSPPVDSPKEKLLPVVVTRRLNSWPEILFSKVNFALQFLLGCVVSSGKAFLSSRSTVTTAVFVLSFLYFRQRRRLRAGGETRARLTSIINEKDKKINQLLDQISRMNQVLLGFHRAQPTT